MKCLDRPNGDSKGHPIKTKNGDLFLVQDDGDLLALGLIARGENRAIKLGYFFEISAFERCEDINNVEIASYEAIHITKFSYLHLKNGKWPIVGHLRNFSRDIWPMPVFRHQSILLGSMRYRLYNEEKLEKMIVECDDFDITMHATSNIIANDGIEGAIYVENFLKDLLVTSKVSVN